MAPIPFSAAGDGSQTFIYTYSADKIWGFDQSEVWREQDRNPYTLIYYTTDNQQDTDKCESAGFLAYHPGERYAESLSGAYYGNLLPPMEVDEKEIQQPPARTRHRNPTEVESKERLMDRGK